MVLNPNGFEISLSKAEPNLLILWRTKTVLTHLDPRISMSPAPTIDPMVLQRCIHSPKVE
jgi:hypothetical protein